MGPGRRSRRRGSGRSCGRSGRDRCPPLADGFISRLETPAGLAESLWQQGKLDLLIWVDATSRAAVLAGYAAAAVAASSTDPADDAETVAIRLVNWLAKTSRPWLLVLDDLSDPADLEDLWPTWPAGKVLITTADVATSAPVPG